MAFLELGLQVINPEIVSGHPDGSMRGLSRPKRGKLQGAGIVIEKKDRREPEGASRVAVRDGREGGT